MTPGHPAERHAFAIVDNFLRAFAACREQLLAVELGVVKQSSTTANGVVEAPSDEGGDTDTQDSARADGEQVMVDLSQRLTHCITTMFDQTGIQNDQQVLLDVQYALAALVDERLLYTINWPGRAHWSAFLIEARIFATASAGREVYVRIDKLAVRKLHADTRKQLSMVYLMLLQLGFRGECRGQARTVQRYCQNLSRDIAEHNSTAKPARRAFSRYTFVQAYAQNISEAVGQRVSSMRHWWQGAVLIALLYMVVSSTVWWYYIRQFEQVLVG